MSLNLGLDFGSTYTLVSVYNPNEGGLSCINITCGTPYIPSVVSFDPVTGRYNYGSAAHSRVGEDGMQIFTAFKTLLNSRSDDPVVTERGYDEKNTPIAISRIFLEKLLRRVMSNYGESEIENLVIGVPEVWGKSFKGTNGKKSIASAEGRKAIKQIFQELDFVKHLQIVSEPQAASAFFAYNYRNMQQENLDGQVLIIDYGGGTLDITLSRITTLDDGQRMEIKVIDSDGDGENRSGKIGNAGILYMEALLRYAMKAAGISITGVEGNFLQLESTLEAALRNNVEEVNEIFEEMIPEELDGIVFLRNLEYKNGMEDAVPQKFNITYGQMYKVYQEEIYPTLDNVISRIVVDVDTTNDNFKIGLVGGFSNFYLVRKQVYDKFRITNSGDKRVAGLLRNPEEREKAISLGAALLANNMIDLCETTEYALGVYLKAEGKIIYNYGIRFRQEIEYDKVYFARDAQDRKYIVRSVNGNLERLLIKIDMDDRNAFDMRPKEVFAKRLQNVIRNAQRTAFVGFSIKENGVISIHIHECDPLTRTETGEPRIIELTDFDNMFEPTAL